MKLPKVESQRSTTAHPLQRVDPSDPRNTAVSVGKHSMPIRAFFVYLKIRVFNPWILNKASSS